MDNLNHVKVIEETDKKICVEIAHPVYKVIGTESLYASTVGRCVVLEHMVLQKDKPNAFDTIAIPEEVFELMVQHYLKTKGK